MLVVGSSMYNNEVVPSIAVTRTELSINQNFISSFIYIFLSDYPHCIGVGYRSFKIATERGRADTEWREI